jgi:hypothetical protein
MRWPILTVFWGIKYSVTFVGIKTVIDSDGGGVARARCVWAEVHEETAPAGGTTRATSSADESLAGSRCNVAIGCNSTCHDQNGWIAVVVGPYLAHRIVCYLFAFFVNLHIAILSTSEPHNLPTCRLVRFRRKQFPTVSCAILLHTPFCRTKIHGYVLYCFFF